MYCAVLTAQYPNLQLIYRASNGDLTILGFGYLHGCKSRRLVKPNRMAFHKVMVGPKGPE